jgi:hypothetical protein
MVIVCAMVALAWNALCHKASAQPQTAVVRVDGDNGSPNPSSHGTDWGSDAYKYLQDALSWAAYCVDPYGGGYASAEVWVAATDEDNPYRPDRDANNPGGTDDRHVSFQLLNKVILYGGFEGDETALSQRNIYMNETVLSGDLNGDDGPEFTNRIDNSFHVVTTPQLGSVTSRIDNARDLLELLANWG